MVTLATRIEEIFEVEGFKIKVEDWDEDPVDRSTHGVLEHYPFKKALPGEKTVGDWKRLRFSPTDPESYSCEVVTADGTPIKDDVSLEFVRDSYV